MTVDDDYEEPLLTVVEGDGAGTSSGGRTETTRAAIISVESDYSQQGRTWQWRNAFNIYCVALFVCFVVTMGLHPGITSFICSTQNPAFVSGRRDRRVTGGGSCIVCMCLECMADATARKRSLSSFYRPPNRSPRAHPAPLPDASTATCLFPCSTSFSTSATSPVGCCPATVPGPTAPLPPSPSSSTQYSGDE